MGQIELATRAKGRHVRKERDPLSHVHGTLLHRKRIDELRDPLDDKFFITFEGIGVERSGPWSSSAGMLCLVPNGNQRLYVRLGNASIPDYNAIASCLNCVNPWQ